MDRPAVTRVLVTRHPTDHHDDPGGHPEPGE
jgi:hypothetical protein